MEELQFFKNNEDIICISKSEDCYIKIFICGYTMKKQSNELPTWFCISGEDWGNAFWLKAI